MNSSSLNKKLAILALATAILFVGMPTARAVTYTWTQTATGTQSWTNTANWADVTADSIGDVFVSGSGNELTFNSNGPGTAGQTITDVPATLSMNKLTLSGQGPNNTAGSDIIIGDDTSIWTIGDGTTSQILHNSTVGGGSSDRELRYNVAANLTLNQATTTINASSGGGSSKVPLTLSGDITEAVAGYGITKIGSNLAALSGDNTYTGPTTITAGTLRLGSSTALPGGIGATGGTSALTINGGVVQLAAGNFERNLGTGSDQFQITGGTSGFGAAGAPWTVTVNNDANKELVWGSTYFQPSTLVLSADNGLTLANKIDLNGTTRTVNASAAVLSGNIRTSSGTAGLTKTGSGTLVLSGSNSYNGPTTISAGTLSVGAADNLGAASADLVFDGGTLRITGTELTNFSDLGRTVTWNANKTLGFNIADAANTFTPGQVLSQGSGGLVKDGVGTLVLDQANTFTGATTVTGGGTLVLDYSSEDNSKLSNTAALSLSGGNLVLRGGSHTEVVSGISLSGGNTISRDGGSTSTINLGAISGSYLSISESSIVKTTSAWTVSNGITVAGHFSSTDGDGFIVPYSGYYTYSEGVDGGGSASTVNQWIGGGTSASVNFSGSSGASQLRIGNSGDSDVLGNATFGVGWGGTIFYGGGHDNNFTINGGNFTVANNNQQIKVNIFDGCTLTMNGSIGNGGMVTKTGAGTLVAGGTINGARSVVQGALRRTISDAAAFTVSPGAALELANNITLSGALSIGGGTLRNFSGDNTYSGAITVGAGGVRIDSDAGLFTITGGINSAVGADVNFGGASNITVSTTPITGGGNLIKKGTGTLTLTGNNTYTGLTTVSDGTLRVGAGGSLGSGNVLVDSNGTLDFNSAGSLSVANQISGSGSITQTGSGTTTLYGDSSGFGGTTSVSAGTLVVDPAGSLGGNASVSGGLLTVNGSLGGIVTVTGGTVIGGGTIGTLVINNGGTSSPGNSPETMVVGTYDMNPGGTYLWEINDLTGTAGSDPGWDLYDVTTLDITDLTSSGKFNILITDDTGGLLAAPGKGSALSWNIVDYGSITKAFSADYFALSTSGFDASWSGVTWSIYESGSSLWLQAYIIPEPSTLILAGLGLAGLTLRRRRR